MRSRGLERKYKTICHIGTTGEEKKKRKKKVKGGKKCCEGFSISITAAYISTVYQEKGIATTICSLPSLKKKKKKEREGDNLYVTVDSTISVILCLQEETFQLHHIGYIG